MPFGKELSHLIEEQINRAVTGNSSAAGVGAVGGTGVDEGRIALIEANIQRLGEQFASFLSAQKSSKRDLIDYGLEVIALHDMRLAVTAGRAIFADKDAPLDLPYSYLQLSDSGSAREIRYIYLNSAGVVLESTTDPSNIGTGMMPLALVDVWSNTTEITQDKIKDLRPRAGSDESGGSAQTQTQLTGNVSLYSPDTGNDSFIVSAVNPAGLKVNITSGRALVDGEVVDAEGGVLDLSSHRTVEKEFIAISDGVKTAYNLFHQSVENVIVYLDDVETQASIDAAGGSLAFSPAPPLGAKITASYTFTGNYMLVFLVEKTQTSSGASIGVIGWKAGSNRSSSQPPELSQYQHVIAKIDMSGAIAAITDAIIDNSYEIINLTQQELQTGEKLEGSSLKAGTITGDKIAAAAITGDKISAGAIDAANIKAGAIQSDHIAAGAVTSAQIAANAITADMIQSGIITASNFEDATWGDLSQALRFVKAILGGDQSWRRALSAADLAAAGASLSNVAVNSDSFPSIRLATIRHWDDGTQWDSGAWDIPVYTTGFWESASIDYGAVGTLQAELWAQLLIDDPAVAITVKAKYSTDNAVWTAYETLLGNAVSGYRFWTGTLQQFRYFKVRVEFSTIDGSKYMLLGYPEVRAANCQIGTEDISNGAITAAKLAPDLRSRLGV